MAKVSGEDKTKSAGPTQSGRVDQLVAPSSQFVYFPGMTRFSPARRCAIGFLLCLGLWGCGDNTMDEEKEPHFLKGRNLLMQGDFEGAIGSFEKALAINPRSASAHFELAVMFESHDKGNDPAAAIYHYERFLKIRPGSPRADLVRQEINACKMDLAKTITVAGPAANAEQHDLATLLAENKRLTIELAKYRACYSAAGGALTNNPPAVPVRQQTNPVPAETRNTATNPGPMARTTFSSGRIYTIKPGDTPVGIARRHGISTASLMAANPGVKATALQPGHTLNLPGP